MTEAVSTVMDLDHVTKTFGGNSNRDLDAESFMSAFDQGLDVLSKRPEFQEETTAMEAISGTYQGDVGEAKANMVGGQADPDVQTSEEAAQTLEERFQSLYFELTHYQIAWRIAQNVQRDISQVLRGS